MKMRKKNCSFRSPKLFTPHLGMDERLINCTQAFHLPFHFISKLIPEEDTDFTVLSRQINSDFSVACFRQLKKCVPGPKQCFKLCMKSYLKKKNLLVSPPDTCMLVTVQDGT